MNDFVHVFSGQFHTEMAACQYSEAQWEPEPSKSSSDEEYEAWENRNPTWQLKTDLDGIYLDRSFIETIYGDDRYDYLNKMLTEADTIGRIRAISTRESNTLVLIFSEALGGFPAKMKSTPRLDYCGRFSCQL